MTNKKHRDGRLGKLMFILVAFALAIFIGDMVYDRNAPEAAKAQCGQNAVKSVDTSGFFNVDIECERPETE